MGEIISTTAAATKTSAAKFFPGNSDPVDLDQMASMLTRATEEHDNVLRSAARGGVKIALAMLWAWYPEINMHMATEYMPEEDEPSASPRLAGAVEEEKSQVNKKSSRQL